MSARSRAALRTAQAIVLVWTTAALAGCGAGSWRDVSLDGAPIPGINHVSVWTGETMIVYGGLAASDPVMTGARYDPKADAWTTPETRGPLMTRPSVAWTGTEMFVWGGCEVCLGPYGARYDPDLDAWTGMSSLGAPPGNGSIVWTGVELIVWGGRSSGTVYEQTGARYDPFADAWTPMTTAGAPRGRSGHTAVWTGEEMIIWGGADGDGWLATGARYSPETNTWADLPVEGAPSARSEHTATWTGELMLVWGGVSSYEPAAVLAEGGGRYDPGTNTWSPMSNTGQPKERIWHTAVWTGADLVVFGGVAQGSGARDPTLRSGGVYDPVADRWRPLERAGAPGQMFLHTAVWTGEEMIIWGDDDKWPGGRWRP